MWVAVLLLCGGPGDCRLYAKKEPFVDSVSCMRVLLTEVKRYDSKKTIYLVGGDCFEVSLLGEET